MGNSSLTLAVDSPLALLTATTEDNAAQADRKSSYVGFFSKKSESVVEISMACPGIQDGQPYCFDGTKYKFVNSLSLVGPTFRYFGQSVDNKLVRASLIEDRGDRDMKECVVAPVLAFCGDKVIPTLSNFRTTKAKVVSDLLGGQAKASDDKTVAAAGPIGKQLTKLPVALRVAGEIDTFAKTSQPNAKGETFGYTLARARTRLLNDVELQALMNALTDADFNDSVALITESYNRRKEVVTKLLG